MDEKTDIFGDSIKSALQQDGDINISFPASTQDSVTMAKDEDSEADMIKSIQRSSSLAADLAKTQITVDTVQLPDYNDIKRRIALGEQIFAVKNVANIVFKRDWDLSLFPEELEKDFLKFLTSKYIEYNLVNLAKSNIIITALYIDGKTLDFVDMFCAIKDIPSSVTTQVGKDVVKKSRILIRPEESVLFTLKQLKGIEQYEKVKHAYDKGDGKTEHSDWLGFLIFGDPLDQTSDLTQYKRSIISFDDVLRSGISVPFEEVRVNSRVNDANIIKAKA